jgi:hypothetical protein
MGRLATVLLGVWVLWSFRGEVGKAKWFPDEGFNTKDECVALASVMMSKFEKMEGAQRTGRLVIFTDKDSRGDHYTNQIAFTCLPDTIDPRK